MTDRETVRPASTYRAGTPDHAVRASRDDLLRVVTEPAPGEVILDCRTLQEYSGLASGPGSEFGDLCAERGHVPGAVNIPAGDIVTPEGALLPVEQLQEVFRARGIGPEQHITAYCHTADRSSLVWFALSQVLGYPSVRVYDGGWVEYGHLLGAPVIGPEDGPAELGHPTGPPPPGEAPLVAVPNP